MRWSPTSRFYQIPTGRTRPRALPPRKPGHISALFECVSRDSLASRRCRAAFPAIAHRNARAGSDCAVAEQLPRSSVGQIGGRSGSAYLWIGSGIGQRDFGAGVSRGMDSRPGILSP
jgi:hypothetical protein